LFDVEIFSSTEPPPPPDSSCVPAKKLNKLREAMDSDADGLLTPWASRGLPATPSHTQVFKRKKKTYRRKGNTNIFLERKHEPARGETLYLFIQFPLIQHLSPLHLHLFSLPFSFVLSLLGRRFTILFLYPQDFPLSLFFLSRRTVKRTQNGAVCYAL
jgi:hypothetical protein